MKHRLSALIMFLCFCAAVAAGEEKNSLNLEASAKILDGGLYHLDDPLPLNGLWVGIKLKNTAKPSERLSSPVERNIGAAYVLKYKTGEGKALNVRDVLEIPSNLSFKYSPAHKQGYSIDELKAHLDPDKLGRGKAPDQLTFSNSDIWVKWVRAEESLDDFWRLGTAIKIPTISPVPYVDFKITRETTEDDKKVAKALLRLNEHLTFAGKQSTGKSDLMGLLPDVEVDRIDPFDGSAPIGMNADGYLDAGETSSEIPVNVGSYYNFTRPGRYRMKVIIYGPAHNLPASGNLTFRVLPFRRTDMTLDELKKDVNDRQGGPPLYPWMIYEVLDKDGVREVVYSQRRFRITGQAVHDFYRLCRIMPGSEVLVSEKSIYRGCVYTRTESGRRIYAEINFDYRYPLVNFRYMARKQDIPRKLSPNGEIEPPVD